MVRSIRMFEIIQILRNTARPVTAEQIATNLGVSKRTAYRDIAALQAARVPIDGEAGIGYILRPGFDMPPITFQCDELEAISVGLALLGRTGDTGLQRAAQRVLLKMDESLSQTGGTQDKFAVSAWNEVPTSTVDVAMIREAIRSDQSLEVTYCDALGTTTERAIKPLALIYYVDSLVIAAWCALRKDFRHFRVDRILETRTSAKLRDMDADTLRSEWKRRHSI